MRGDVLVRVATSFFVYLLHALHLDTASCRSNRDWQQPIAGRFEGERERGLLPRYRVAEGPLAASHEVFSGGARRTRRL
ncbi:hypothetical protein GUJ93_ZPchr0012g20222 [Zizania palustris]|uniref:Secreted protein n=1 Tax=Zizania palustris TaxID=103762 RepID=A0A8J6BU36_ZIZPA|nr:hypothetical protein GUJ93_ZPchr0012g20222 [Zizania palustris]